MPESPISRVYSGGPFEERAGYCRALRCGDLVFTAGTLALNEQGEMQGDNCYEQCSFIFRKLGGALEKLGSRLDRVVKIVAYLTDLNDAEQFMRALKENLGTAQPVATAVQVSGLFGSGGLVEIELVAAAD